MNTNVHYSLNKNAFACQKTVGQKMSIKIPCLSTANYHALFRRKEQVYAGVLNNRSAWYNEEAGKPTDPSKSCYHTNYYIWLRLVENNL